MQASLLRAPNGNVMFMEANSELIDMLIDIMNKPLGGVIRCVSGKMDPDAENESKEPVALGGLVASMSALRPALFYDSLEGMLPKPTDLSKVHEEAFGASISPSPKQKEPSQCVLCMKVYGPSQRGTIHQPGTCDECGQYTERYCPNTGHGACCAASYMKQNMNQYNWCVPCGIRGTTAYTNQQRACKICKKSNHRVCSHCRHCDPCGISSAGYVLDGISRTPEKQKRTKETVKFLVTNDLQIFENSSIKAFELISTHSKDLTGIKPQAVNVTARHLHAMLQNALLGSATILDDTFQNVDAADDSRSVATDASFSLISDSGQASPKQEAWKCDKCNRSFQSEPALASHKKSKKH